MRRFIRIALLSVMTTGLMFSANSKVARDLTRPQPGTTVDVILRYKTPPTEKHVKKVKDRGGRCDKTLAVVKGLACKVSASSLDELAADPNVEYVGRDHEVKATTDYAVPTVNADIALKYGYDGRGVTVAVIDSGIMDSHPDLHGKIKGKDRVVYEENFVTAAKDRTKAPDEYGHGTHVAGILGGDGSMSSGPKYSRTFRGIAPQVRFVNLKVLDEYGVGSDSGVIAAIQRAIELKDTYDIRVINLSLGRPVVESYLFDPLCQAVEQAWKAGIVVVVAAGNEGRGTAEDWGYGTISAPGNDPYVITVGAMNDKRTLTRSDDVIASYSSKGPTLFDHVVKPDLVAPGNRIVATEQSDLWLSKSIPANRTSRSYYVIGAKETSPRLL